MAINERLIDTEVAAAGNGGGGTGNQEEGLILHLDANDVDSYDGDGTEWVDIKDHEYTPATNVSEHFNTVLYTGTGATNFITGVGFQPDLIWIKDRTATENHYLIDSVRGKNGGSVFENLYPNLTNAQANDNAVTSLDEDGFTLQASGNGNVSGESNVAWCFKAGGAAVSNTDGTITSQVSANNDLGFSIATYTGVGYPASSTAEIGHGLDTAPELVIIKGTGGTGQSGGAGSWVVGSSLLGAGWDGSLYLNSANGYYSATNYFWNGKATSSVIKLKNDWFVNGSNNQYVAYCFASKRGVSKVGSYTGTGATNKVYTGFEPAFIIGKCSSNDVTNWWTFDNKREDKVLYPNLNNSEDTLSDYVSFNRDGFTLSSAAFVNQSGRDFIYYAVAKNTNETSLIPDTDLELHLDAASFPQKNETGYSNTPSTWTALTGSNGTITGATFDSELGNWLDFDGVDDKITVSGASGLTFGDSAAYSVEMWLKPNTDGSNRRLYSTVGAGGGAKNQNSVSITSDQSVHIYYTTGTGTAVARQQTAANAIDNNKWNHLLITQNGTTIKCYINGNDTSLSSGSSTTISQGSDIIFGSHGTGYAPYYKGQIGQLRLYSSILTQDQIRQNYNFTKPSYPNGYDFSGINMNSADWNPEGYFDFDGSSEYFINNNISLDTSKPFSVSTWFYPTQDSEYQRIFAFGTTATEFILQKRGDNNNSRTIARVGGSIKFDVTGPALPNNTWHLGVVTGDGSNIKMYINDSTAVTDSIDGTYVYNNLQIGFGTGTSEYFTGRVANLKVYDRVLSAAEITALHSNGLY